MNMKPAIAFSLALALLPLAPAQGFPKALRFLFALMLIGSIMILGEAHAADGIRSLKQPICETTSIKEIGSRLQGESAETSGSSVLYSNGTTGISYEYIS